jgi:hypothetical protein
VKDPDILPVGEMHESRCWLQHPQAITVPDELYCGEKA